MMMTQQCVWNYFKIWSCIGNAYVCNVVTVCVSCSYMSIPWLVFLVLMYLIVVFMNCVAPVCDYQLGQSLLQIPHWIVIIWLIGSVLRSTWDKYHLIVCTFIKRKRREETRRVSVFWNLRSIESTRYLRINPSAKCHYTVCTSSCRAQF